MRGLRRLIWVNTLYTMLVFSRDGAYSSYHTLTYAILAWRDLYNDGSVVTLSYNWSQNIRVERFETHWDNLKRSYRITIVWPGSSLSRSRNKVYLRFLFMNHFFHVIRPKSGSCYELVSRRNWAYIIALKPRDSSSGGSLVRLWSIWVFTTHSEAFSTHEHKTH